MSGIKDMLFGSDPGYTGEQAPNITPQQEAYLNQIMGTLGGEMGRGITPYGGQTVAGASPIQSQLFNLISQQMGGGGAIAQGQQAIAQGQQPYQAGMGTLENIMGQYDPASAIKSFEPTKQMAMESWEKDVIPAVLEPFIGQGAFDSGASRRAVAQSGEQLTGELARQLGERTYAGEQAHLGRQAQALPQALNYANLPLSQIQALSGMASGAGGTQQQLAQNQLTGAYNQWQQGQPWANPWLQYMGMPLGVNAADPIVSQGSQGLFGGLAEGAGQGLGMTLPYLLMSDKRLKKNITYLPSDGPLKPVTFRYIWDTDNTPLRTGLIAQDLLKVRPDLVVTIGPYYAINYGGL